MRVKEKTKFSPNKQNLVISSRSYFIVKAGDFCWDQGDFIWLDAVVFYSGGNFIWLECNFMARRRLYFPWKRLHLAASFTPRLLEYYHLDSKISFRIWNQQAWDYKRLKTTRNYHSQKKKKVSKKTEIIFKILNYLLFVSRFLENCSLDPQIWFRCLNQQI